MAISIDGRKDLIAAESLLTAIRGMIASDVAGNVREDEVPELAKLVDELEIAVVNAITKFGEIIST